MYHVVPIREPSGHSGLLMSTLRPLRSWQELLQHPEGGEELIVGAPQRSRVHVEPLRVVAGEPSHEVARLATLRQLLRSSVEEDVNTR